MIYVGLPRYTEQTIDKLIEMGQRGTLDGIILGDLTCNKRMFPCGGSELIAILEQLKKNRLHAIYQSPMYLTDRIFSHTVQEIEYFDKKEYIDAVILQDVGLAAVLKEKCPNLKLIWGKMGYARTPVMNQATVAFYRSQGVHGFECKTVAQAEYLLQIGETPYLLVGHPHYLTVNRECYYKYQNNIFDDRCDCGCLKGQRLDISTEPPIVSHIDGYFLGYENVYSEENMDCCDRFAHTMVYADSTETLNRIVCSLKKREGEV